MNKPKTLKLKIRRRIHCLCEQVSNVIAHVSSVNRKLRQTAQTVLTMNDDVIDFITYLLLQLRLCHFYLHRHQSTYTYNSQLFHGLFIFGSLFILMTLKKLHLLCPPQLNLHNKDSINIL